MVVGAVSSRTELAIIGAGPGGYVAALRAADAGFEVTLIEQGPIGGTCLNVGCVPSKALIELADLRHRAMHASALGLHAEVGVDAAQINAHLHAVGDQLRNGVTTLLDDAGVEVVHGTANFARYDRISIESGPHVSHLEFDNAIVSIGSRPIQLPAFPVGGRVVSSTGALELIDVPPSMVVIGGGYIGVELGTAWAKLGSTVTIVEAQDSILPELPAVLTRPVQQRLDELGIRVLTNRRADSPTAAGLLLDDGTDIGADVIVVAVGRRPNSDRAGLDRVGTSVDSEGHVVVDQQMRAAPGIYAIGDLVAGPALAHKATAEAEVAVHAIAGGTETFDPAAIPAVIFGDPEIMTVGLAPEPDESAGYTVHRFPHRASARAHTHTSTTGATFVVADRHGTVVGVHAVGPHVSELAGEAALAVEMAATLDDMSLTIHPHPTMSESIAEAAWLGRGMPLHIRR